MITLSNSDGDLFPLLLSRVHACRVVGASVQEDDRTTWGRPDGSKHSIDVKPFQLG
jgi:hypothetical protein